MDAPQDEERQPETDAPQDDTQDTDREPFSQRISAAAANLSPDEIVPPQQVGAVLGALLFAHDNDGELPGPLHERFPDQYPEPNKD